MLIVHSRRQQYLAWIAAVLSALFFGGVHLTHGSLTRIAPFQAEDLNGNAVRLPEDESEYYFVYFWASWCRGCMARMPSVVALHHDLQDKGARFVSISLDYHRKPLEEAIQRLDIGFPVIFSGAGWDDALAQRFGVESIPDNFILDRQLNVIARDIFGSPLEKALHALARDDLASAEAVFRRSEEEKQALGEIRRLWQGGRQAEAREAMERFLEGFPDSDQAVLVRGLLDSPERSNEIAGSAPEAVNLRPPAPGFPSEVFVPEFAVGSPAKETSEYLRQIVRAVEAYHEDTDAYPPSLDALARNPAYMSQIPPDPFGDEFLYRTDRNTYWILAGKGPDRVFEAQIQNYQGDPKIFRGILYAENEESASKPGDIVAYRPAPGRETVAE